MATSRASPQKKLTLPRLELKAAVAAVQLATFVVSALQMYLDDMHSFVFNSGVTTKLCCIFSNKQLKQFVVNRYCVQAISNFITNYCHTTGNATDLLT